MSNETKAVDLQPLLDRLKRTDAPTEEETQIWRYWRFQGKALTSCGYGCDPGDDMGELIAAAYWMPAQEAYECGEATPAHVCLSAGDWSVGSHEIEGEWRPVPTVAELLALAALPGKVAEAMHEAARTAILAEHLEDPVTDSDRAYDRAIADAHGAVVEVDWNAIVAACAKC